MSDTVYALSSAPGRAGVAVVRVSGGAAAAVVIALAGALPPPRQAALKTLRAPTGLPLDRALVLWFPGPASFTGEDVVEFHIHGGRAIREAVLAAIAAVEATRPAEPGEFTRRAVESGKLDLTQAEALLDLIEAETEAQRRQALRQYGGALEALYEGWRTRLIRALAWAEAEIDFSDEDLPSDIRTRVGGEVAEIVDEIETHLADRRGEIIRDGLFLTVIGPPNAGKSSLVNLLARRDVAIVSEIAGTTRDIVEVRLDIGGYEVLVADTAGLRDAADAVESEGIRRALARAAQSDLTLLVLDASAADPWDGIPAGLQPDLVVWNKSDLGAGRGEGLRMSCRTGEGISNLLLELNKLVRDRLDKSSDAPSLTRVRHRLALEQAVTALRRAGGSTELFAEDLRLAMRSLGRITGRVDVEDLLDVVFRDFCIGK